jgi:hypothetical protein
MAARRQEQQDQAPDQAAAPQDGEQPTDAVTEEVQAKVDEETEKGFRGTEVDPVDNRNYTVEGVTSGAPTPESDADLARQVRSQIDSR